AGVPCAGKRGHGHRRDAGNRHPVTVNELRGFRHVICFPGDWPGDECPASPERTGKEFALGIVDPSMAGVATKKDFRVRTASSADRPLRFRRRTSLERLRKSLPSGFERQATSLRVWPTCVPALPGAAPIIGNSVGQKL